MLVIPAAIGAIGALASSILGAVSNKNTNTANAQAVADTNATNLQIAQNTNSMNQAINEQNIALTREQNAINREREDNAVRRRANDLVGAGLSKTLAAGNPASANAMQAPQATEAMVTGHQMQAANRKAYSFDNLATAGKLVQEGILANKQLEVDNKALDVRLQELEEEGRHNRAMESYDSASISETGRHNLASESLSERNIDVSLEYLSSDNYWKQQYYDQNSQFHNDAVRLEEAFQSIQRFAEMSEDTLRKMQESWYQSEIDFNKTTTKHNAMRLTAELAESSAKVAEINSNTELNSKELEVASALIGVYASETAEAVARIRNLDANTKNILKDRLIKSWNLAIAKRENTTTTSSVPSKTEVEQLKKSRIASYVQKGVSTGLSVGAGIFLGSGGGKFINKMLGMDDHNPIGFIKH